MRAFIPYSAVTPGTNELLWYYENEHGSTIGPFESEEHAAAASEAARKEYLTVAIRSKSPGMYRQNKPSRNPPDGGSGPGM